MSNINNNIGAKKPTRAGSHGGSLARGRQANIRDPEFQSKLDRFYAAFGVTTPAELAPFLGIQPESIYHAKDKGNIPSTWLEKAFALGASVDWLLSGAGSMRRHSTTPPPEKRTEAEPESISERLLFLISDKAGGKPPIFSNHSGVPYVALLSYIQGSTPIPEHLVRIRDSYAVNLDWLLHGKGEPYIKDLHLGASETKYDYNLPEHDYEESPPANSRLDKIVSLARKVLASDNPQAAEALEKNIRYFAHAVEVESRLASMEERLAALEESFTKTLGRKNFTKEG